MVFGLFSRKPLPVATQTDTDIQSSNEPSSTAQLRTPSPSLDSGSIGKQNSPSHEPPLTPSPPPERNHVNATDLHALILSIPPQTLHSYTVTRLGPSNPPNPETLGHLSSFFADLVPPPRLHCVRCHKAFFEVENTDRSCLVPHDDDSAAVERVASSKSKEGTLYETLWGCCGRTVEGNGDMGPPDGWCYEGKHTTDTKRARFRADSTLQDDKLTSCDRLRCHEPPRSPRAMRKRGRPLVEDDDREDESEESSISSIHSSSPHSSGSRRRTAKKARTHVKPAKESEAPVPEEVVVSNGHDPEAKDAMDVDVPAAPAPVVQAIAHPPTTPPSPSPPKSKPKSRAKPKPAPLSSKLTAPKTSSPLVLSPPYVSHSPPAEPLSRASTRVVISTKSKSSIAPAPTPAAAAAPLKHKSSAASLKAAKSSAPESPKPAAEPVPLRGRTKSTSTKETGAAGSKPRAKSKSRARGKTLAEVVDSSVDGERHILTRG